MQRVKLTSFSNFHKSPTSICKYVDCTLYNMFTFYRLKFQQVHNVQRTRNINIFHQQIRFIVHINGNKIKI